MLIDGNFSLTVANEEAILVVSYVGMVSREVNATRDMHIVLQSDSELLDEVVVVGYGTQRKVNLTGSVAAVTIDETITSRSLTNVSSGLQGLIPGLQVSQTTSMAGRDGASFTRTGYGQ